MYIKEIKEQFKEDLSEPGEFSMLQWDPLKHGANPKSFRSTAMYAATSLGMKIRTEFQGDELVCQRIDVPHPDSARTKFNATLRSDMDAAANLINILHPMPGDEHYDLKSALVSIAVTSITQHSLAVQRHLAENGDSHED